MTGFGIRNSMTDWKALIRDLRAKRGGNMTVAQIATAVGAKNPSNISELARNGGSKEPRHHLGQKILALHAERCRKAA